MLQSTDLRQLKWTVSDDDQTDRIKSLAFQLGQAVTLNDGVELYTKKDLADYMPELRPYLYRENCTLDDLEDVKNRFIRIISEKGFEDCGNMTVKFPGPPVRYIDLKGKEQDVTTD